MLRQLMRSQLFLIMIMSRSQRQLLQLDEKIAIIKHELKCN